MLTRLYYILTGCNFRYSYWSCSTVSKKLHHLFGIPAKPNATTTQGWKEWNIAAKKASPIGTWITEEGLDIAQDIVFFFPDVYHTTYYKLRNRFIIQSYMIDTKLSKLDYHDSGTRIETGLFNLAVDFVEVEKAHMQDISHNNNIKDRRLAGTKYLDWEISLGDESPMQSSSAKEIKEIYTWIKDIYPNRPDIYDVTGWSAHCNNKEFIVDDEKDDAYQQNVREMINQIQTLEQQYSDEVTDYLTRIVKIREDMWT